jgi:hypothetical protein
MKKLTIISLLITPLILGASELYPKKLKRLRIESITNVVEVPMEVPFPDGVPRVPPLVVPVLVTNVTTRAVYGTRCEGRETVIFTIER